MSVTSDDDDDDTLSRPLARGLTLRALIPNAITSAALCCGLFGGDLKFLDGRGVNLRISAAIVRDRTREGCSSEGESGGCGQNGDS